MLGTLEAPEGAVADAGKSPSALSSDCTLEDFVHDSPNRKSSGEIEDDDELAAGNLARIRSISDTDASKLMGFGNPEFLSTS